jgi:hypothetical protein
MHDWAKEMDRKILIEDILKALVMGTIYWWMIPNYG